LDAEGDRTLVGGMLAVCFRRRNGVERTSMGPLCKPANDACVHFEHGQQCFPTAELCDADEGLYRHSSPVVRSCTFSVGERTSRVRSPSLWCWSTYNDSNHALTAASGCHRIVSECEAAKLGGVICEPEQGGWCVLWNARRSARPSIHVSWWRPSATTSRSTLSTTVIVPSGRARGGNERASSVRNQRGLFSPVAGDQRGVRAR
jgi:hypothetical protein